MEKLVRKVEEVLIPLSKLRVFAFLIYVFIQVQEKSLLNLQNRADVKISTFGTGIIKMVCKILSMCTGIVWLTHSGFFRWKP